MLEIILKKFPLFTALTNKNNDSLKNKLIKGTAGSFGLKIASNALAFLMSIIFARFLGKAGLGIYMYATTWANLLSVPATIGIDRLVVKEIAVYRAKSQWELMAGLLRGSNLLVSSASIAIAIIATAIVLNVQGDIDETVVIAVAMAMITVPIASLRNLRSGAMRGLNRVVLGQVPDSLLAPLIVVCLTCLTYLLFPENFNVFWLLGIKITAITITFFIGSWWLLKSLPSEVKQAKPQYVWKKWLVAGLPFMFLGTVELVYSRIDIVMLGSIKDVQAVGTYTIIVGITQLAVFIHYSANSALAPNIASLYSENKLKQLEQIVRRSLVIVFLLSLMIAGTVMGLGKYILAIFGSEFISGRTAMNILIAGQLFEAFTGPVGLLLSMTGHQKYIAFSTGASAVLNIILNAILIPRWGINGAAAATSASIIVINIANVILVQKKLGISLYSLNLKRIFKSSSN